MNRRTVDMATELLAGNAMGRLAEFETLERHAIRRVFLAARAGTEVAEDYLACARNALGRRRIH